MQRLFALQLHHEERGTDRVAWLEAARTDLIRETGRLFDHFASVLELAVVLARVAEADKHGAGRNLAKNRWVQALAKCERLATAYDKGGRLWDHQMNIVRQWFRELIKGNETYQAYSKIDLPSLSEDKTFMTFLFRKLILGKTTIAAFFEERIIAWAEDRAVIRGLVEKTVKSYDPDSSTEIALAELSLDWQDDCLFMERLLEGTAKLDPSYRTLIASNMRNWELDRLPLTDRILLEMAVSEMLAFPNIPVKVTINEYIELAKQYSTPKSWQFVNGILDAISRILVEKGEVRKSGRGLIDNK